MDRVAKNNILTLYILFILLALTGCRKKTDNDKKIVEQRKEGSFGYDLAFLKKHTELLVLTAPDNKEAMAVVIPDYQGRVMTSTVDGALGNSYGWINYDLISSGTFQPHMNAFGGEERLWLSPEGGQFSIYFKKGKTFEFKNWQTPPLIDTVAFKVTKSDASSASFEANAMLQNYTGTTFIIRIKRKVTMLDRSSISGSLDIGSLENCKSVAYESENSIVNEDSAWKPETGMLGIWLLGMFKPSEKTVIVAPFSTRLSDKLLITDDYFGKIPAGRLTVKGQTVFLKADGKSRSKIGIAPRSASNVAGSYDAEKGVLTIIQFDLKPEERYLKSTWEIHKDPYDGDALNAYNDGKLEDGTQMGPFYELESNSPTSALNEGETLTHRQRTYHFEGEKAVLNEISTKVLGVKIDQIVEVFK
jgi:hypothetical protein